MLTAPRAPDTLPLTGTLAGLRWAGRSLAHVRQPSAHGVQAGKKHEQRQNFRLRRKAAEEAIHLPAAAGWDCPLDTHLKTKRLSPISMVSPSRNGALPWMGLVSTLTAPSIA
jgi:hypothetical protein